jgi:hypothetical protein
VGQRDAPSPAFPPSNRGSRDEEEQAGQVPDPGCGRELGGVPEGGAPRRTVSQLAVYPAQEQYAVAVAQRHQWRPQFQVQSSKYTRLYFEL